MTKKIVIANWKMLPATMADAEDLMEKTDEHIRTLGADAPDVVICPPFIFLEDIAALIARGVAAGVSLGAQDIAAQDEGAQTGEVGGAQLVQLGVRYVIIGHSERRYKLGESDGVVNAKLKAALRAGLVPIVCLGERSREGAWHDELASQISGTLHGLTAEDVARCMIAYEPVWAISTSPGAKPDTAASAVQSMAYIREALADRFDASHPMFIYGGSVNAENAPEFLERSEIRGVLVGGASVRADDFGSILKAAAPDA